MNNSKFYEFMMGSIKSEFDQFSVSKYGIDILNNQENISIFSQSSLFHITAVHHQSCTF